MSIIQTNETAPEVTTPAMDVTTVTLRDKVEAKFEAAVEAEIEKKRPTAEQIDQAAQEYLAAKAAKDSWAEEVADKEAELMELVKTWGVVPPHAEKSRRLAGKLSEITVTKADTLTILEERVETLKEDLRREAIADNQARVHAALLDQGPWPLSPPQRKILECLRYRQGRLQAMSIDELQQRIGSCARTIKQHVRYLVVDYRLPIVASRDSESGGYYFAVTAEERIAGSAAYVQEIVALGRRVAIIRNETDMNILWGQIALESKGAQ
jgi:hypothetical protein